MLLLQLIRRNENLQRVIQLVLKQPSGINCSHKVPVSLHWRNLCHYPLLPSKDLSCFTALGAGVCTECVWSSMMLISIPFHYWEGQHIWRLQTSVCHWQMAGLMLHSADVIHPLAILLVCLVWGILHFKRIHVARWKEWTQDCSLWEGTLVHLFSLVGFYRCENKVLLALPARCGCGTWLHVD